MTVIFRQRWKVGYGKREHYGIDTPMLVTAEVTTNTMTGALRLSLGGQIGVNCWGQIMPLFPKLDYGRQIPGQQAEDLFLASDIASLEQLWREFHLNDMQAGCEHQRKANWGKRIVTVGDTEKLSGHVYPSEGGCLTKPCRVCGYRYGSAWVYKSLTRDALKTLVRLGKRYPHVPHYQNSDESMVRGGKVFLEKTGEWWGTGIGK